MTNKTKKQKTVERATRREALSRLCLLSLGAYIVPSIVVVSDAARAQYGSGHDRGRDQAGEGPGVNSRCSHCSSYSRRHRNRRRRGASTPPEDDGTRTLPFLEDAFDDN